LTFDDFCQIDFGLNTKDRYPIINDLISYLSGITYTNESLPKETEEQRRKPSYPTAGADEELQTYKESMSEA
jgi:hypothetical protein